MRIEAFSTIKSTSGVFDSIEFTRLLPDDCERTGAFIFAPYHGTELRDIAVKKGYIKNPDSICDITRPEDSMLDQPQLPRKELNYLYQIHLLA